MAETRERERGFKASACNNVSWGSGTIGSFKLTKAMPWDKSLCGPRR